MTDRTDDAALIEMTAEVVSAYVGNTSLAAADLPALIQSVYGALSTIGEPAPPAAAEAQKPAVSVKKSVTPEFLISLEDGQKYKSLKRHLRTKYGMSPEDYRAKWGLPKDYPMVAPAYAASRSALAKQMGLGRGGGAQAKPAASAKPARKPRAAKAPASAE